MLNPTQFSINEAWLVFQLNDTPINTGRDGAFNAMCLMDAASCFILATEMVSAQKSGPSELEAKRLFKTAWSHNRQFPVKVFIPRGPLESALSTQAQRHAIPVTTVSEDELAVFTREAKQSFSEHFRQSY